LLRFMAVPLGCLAQVYGGATWLPCSGSILLRFLL